MTKPSPCELALTARAAHDEPVRFLVRAAGKTLAGDERGAIVETGAEHRGETLLEWLAHTQTPAAFTRRRPSVRAGS